MEFSDWFLMEQQMGGGRIVTNPLPKGRYKTAPRKWWMIIEVSEEIGRYYRKLLANHSMAKYHDLAPPEWGSHVSVVRGEHPRNEQFWNKWDGQNVHFEYSNEIETKPHTPYYWVSVRCPEAEAIRLELGLSKEPEYGFHLTFARKPS